MKRIEIPFTPGGGQIIKQTGPLSMGDEVEFWWKTPRLGSAEKGFFDPDLVKNGNFFCDSYGGNNSTFTGEFAPFPEGTAGTVKAGSGQSSFSWPFKKSGANDYSLQPDTEYTVRVKITLDNCTGLNGKVNAGPDHD